MQKPTFWVEKQDKTYVSVRGKVAVRAPEATGVLCEVSITFSIDPHGKVTEEKGLGRTNHTLGKAENPYLATSLLHIRDWQAMQRVARRALRESALL